MCIIYECNWSQNVVVHTDTGHLLGRLSIFHGSLVLV
jgi:hypothetical protein